MSKEEDRDPTDEELKDWDRAFHGHGGLAVTGVAMVGKAQVGLADPICARYRASGDRFFIKEWAKILRQHGVIEWSGDTDRPYRWLLEVQDLAGLYPHFGLSWGKLSRMFRNSNNEPVSENSLKNNSKTDWTRPKVIRGDDFSEGREVDLPSILHKLKEVL